LPDEKIPPGTHFKVSCPGCTQPFTVTPSVKPDAGANPESTPKEMIEPMPDPDFFPPGARAALLLLRNSQWIDALRSTLQEDGFHLTVLGDPALASSKMNVNAYDLAIVEHRQEFKSVLEQIHTWPGTKRRKCNVVLIGTEGKSLHPGLSFSKGVDCYFHEQDHARTQELLQAAMQGFDATYQAWHMAAKNLGKEP
jgi:hypothetical protein